MVIFWQNFGQIFEVCLFPVIIDFGDCGYFRGQMGYNK